MPLEASFPPRTALHEQAAGRLRQMLVENCIAPGAKLNERELCEVLLVSRTPLREAIKMLAAEGLVELLPNRGAIAVELSQTDVQYSFEVLAGLQAQAGELAAQRITQAELNEIEAMHFELMAAYTRRDLHAYHRLNTGIHHALNAAARNPVLVATYNQVNARLQALRFRSNQNEGKWAQAMQDHEQMVDALKARDPAALRQVMSSHMLHKSQAVLQQLRAQRGQSSGIAGISSTFGMSRLQVPAP